MSVELAALLLSDRAAAMVREALLGWARRRRRHTGGEETLSLARALADRRRCTLLSFYSPKCKLCARVGPEIGEIVAKEEGDWLSLVRMNVDDEVWLPEVSYYGVAHVPCLVLLDSRGRARFRSAVPESLAVVKDSLGDILSEGRRRFGRSRPSVGALASPKKADPSDR